MARTQILVPGWGNGVKQGFWRFFADGLNPEFNFVCGAGQGAE